MIFRPAFDELVKQLEALRAVEDVSVVTPPVHVIPVDQRLQASDVEARTMAESLRPYDEGQDALMSYEGGRNIGGIGGGVDPVTGQLGGRPSPQGGIPGQGGNRVPRVGEPDSPLEASAGISMMKGMSGLVLTPVDDSVWAPK